MRNKDDMPTNQPTNTVSAEEKDMAKQEKTRDAIIAEMNAKIQALNTIPLKETVKRKKAEEEITQLRAELLLLDVVDEKLISESLATVEKEVNLKRALLERNNEINSKVRLLSKIPTNEREKRDAAIDEIREFFLKLPEGANADLSLNKVIAQFQKIATTKELNEKFKQTTFSSKERAKLRSSNVLSLTDLDVKSKMRSKFKGAAKQIIKNKEKIEGDLGNLRKASALKEKKKLFEAIKTIDLSSKIVEGKDKVAEAVNARMINERMLQIIAKNRSMIPENLSDTASYSEKIRGIREQIGDRLLGDTFYDMFKKDTETNEVIQRILDIEYTVDNYTGFDETGFGLVKGEPKTVKFKDLGEHYSAQVNFLTHKQPSWKANENLKNEIEILKGAAEKYGDFARDAKDPRTDTAKLVDRATTVFRWASGLAIAGAAGAAVTGVAYLGMYIASVVPAGGAGVVIGAGAAAAMSIAFPVAAVGVLVAYLLYKNREAIKTWFSDNVGKPGLAAAATAWENTKNFSDSLRQGMSDTANEMVHAMKSSLLDSGVYKPGRVDAFKGETEEDKAIYGEIEKAVIDAVVVLNTASPHENSISLDLLKRLSPKSTAAQAEQYRTSTYQKIEKEINQNMQDKGLLCVREESGIIKISAGDPQHQRDVLQMQVDKMTEAKTNLDRVLSDYHGQMSSQTFAQFNLLRNNLETELVDFTKELAARTSDIRQENIKEVTLGISQEEAGKRLPLAKSAYDVAEQALSKLRGDSQQLQSEITKIETSLEAANALKVKSESKESLITMLSGLQAKHKTLKEEIQKVEMSVENAVAVINQLTQQSTAPTVGQRMDDVGASVKAAGTSVRKAVSGLNLEEALGRKVELEQELKKHQANINSLEVQRTKLSLQLKSAESTDKNKLQKELNTASADVSDSARKVFALAEKIGKVEEQITQLEEKNNNDAVLGFDLDFDRSVPIRPETPSLEQGAGAIDLQNNDSNEPGDFGLETVFSKDNSTTPFTVKSPASTSSSSPTSVVGTGTDTETRTSSPAPQEEKPASIVERFKKVIGTITGDDKKPSQDSDSSIKPS